MTYIKTSVVALSVVLLTACSGLTEMLKDKVSEPEVAFKELNFGHINKQGIELKPVLLVNNKNGFSIPVDKISYDISFNQKSLLKGKTEQIGKLPANSSKDVALTLPLNKEVLQSLKALLLDNKELDYGVKGAVSVLGFKLPFEKNGTFYRPEISLGKMKTQQASFKQIDLLIDVNVNNKNDISLPIDEISYAISSNGKPLFNGKLANVNLKQGDNTFSIPVTIKPTELFSSLWSALKKPSVPISYTIDSPLLKKQGSTTINIKDFL